MYIFETINGCCPTSIQTQAITPKNSSTTIDTANISKTSQNTNLHFKSSQTQIMTKKKSTPRFHRKIGVCKIAKLILDLPHCQPE